MENIKKEHQNTKESDYVKTLKRELRIAELINKLRQSQNLRR